MKSRPIYAGYQNCFSQHTYGIPVRGNVLRKVGSGFLDTSEVEFVTVHQHFSQKCGV